jgi:AcrR family transcriptional regulator
MGKQEIAERARALFARKGYEGTSMEDIAREVGIKKASLYAHYAGKEAIFRSIYSQLIEDYERNIASGFEGIDDMRIEKALKTIALRYVGFFTDEERNSLWFRLYVDPPAALKEEIMAMTYRSDRDFMERLLAFFKRARRRKAIAALNTAAVATAFFSMIGGLAMTVGFYGQADMGEAVDGCLEVFRKGIMRA